MASTDLVVVLPGIMGSTLNDGDGRPVWAPSAGAALQMIRTLGRSLKQLQLPAGIGDDHPGDGVEPGGLMPDLHVVPGIWTPVTGYDVLVKRLRKLADAEQIGAVLPIGYDWRLSNRHNADRLATVVEPALGRWRASTPERADAQLVFVCHSMGGLLARWYVEKRGGAGHTRKVVTLGTPYRGAARAVEQLVNGVRKGVGPLAVDLGAFARSLPSLHQLLPDYACVDAAGGVHRLDEVAVPGLDTAMTRDALAFHADLAAAERARPASLDATHAIIGIEQPTWTSLRIAGAGVEPLRDLGGTDALGDGTVPLPGAIGHDLPPDTNRVRRVVEQHGNLQANRAALAELVSVLTVPGERYRAAGEVAVRVDVPDLVLAGEPLPIIVEVEDEQQHAVTIEVVDERGLADERSGTGRVVPVAARTPRVRHGRAGATVVDLEPGAYAVRVTGLAPGSPITPVTATTLVWDGTTGT